MDTQRPSLRRLEPRLARVCGVVAAVVGLGLLLVYPLARPVVYPLAPVEWIPGSARVFAATHPLVVYASAVGGAMLLTWGVFAVRYRTRSPLTSRRVLLAPVLSVLCLVGGIAVFTYEWVRGMPVGWCATEPPTEFTPSQIVRIELGPPQFAALAAISAMVVGTIAARRGWRYAAASALVPATLIVGSSIRYDALGGAELLVFLAVVAGLPFAVGYGGARLDEPTAE